MKKICVCILSLYLCASAFSATNVSLKLSGDGAVNDSTITAGKKVTVDVYVENEGNFKGISFGFKLYSDNIKNIIHPSEALDSIYTINKNGDIKAFNGWKGDSIWDLGFFIAPTDWDGVLPDNIGIGGVCMKQVYTPHKSEKKLSFDLLINETGTLMIDSSFFAPAGTWLFAPPNVAPQWDGPYSFTVKK